jgi:hypothetical protein
MSHTPRPSALSILTHAVCFASVLVAASASLATPLPLNSTIAASNAPGTIGGALIANTGPVAISSGTFSGTLTSEVLVNDPANPFGPGNYTFTYLLTNNAVSPDTMDRISVPGYGVAGLLTDASFSTLAPGIAPTLCSRSAGLGDVIGANYFPPNSLSPGTTSELIVIQTNTNQFNQSIASIIDGSTAQVLTFAPLRTVPEPSAFVLGILGMAGLATARRWRFSVKSS